MVKKILALYLISFFVFPPIVFAEGTEEVSYDIVNIKKGDPAPFKDVEIHTWKDKYEAMMILKSTQIEDLRELALKPKPADGPLFVALGFGIGTLTSLGIFAISTEIVSQ